MSWLQIRLGTLMILVVLAAECAWLSRWSLPFGILFGVLMAIAMGWRAFITARCRQGGREPTRADFRAALRGYLATIAGLAILGLLTFALLRAWL